VMGISNLSALIVGILANVAGVALEALGIEVAAWPLLIFSIFGIVFVFIKNFRDSKHIKIKKEPPPQKTREYDILDDCIWEEFPGWFINPKTKEKFCCDCWDAYKIKKRLTKINLSQWVCPKCNKSIESRLNMWKDLCMKKPCASVIRRVSEK